MFRIFHHARGGGTASPFSRPVRRTRTARRRRRRRRGLGGGGPVDTRRQPPDDTAQPLHSARRIGFRPCRPGSSEASECGECECGTPGECSTGVSLHGPAGFRPGRPGFGEREGSGAGRRWIDNRVGASRFKPLQPSIPSSPSLRRGREGKIVVMAVWQHPPRVATPPAGPVPPARRPRPADWCQITRPVRGHLTRRDLSLIRIVPGLASHALSLRRAVDWPMASESWTTKPQPSATA